MATTGTDGAIGAPLPKRKFPGGASLASLVIAPTSSTAHYHDMLKRGHITLQQCAACRRARVPIAPVCPWCHAGAFDWTSASGKGTVVSWVRYRRGYLPEFERLVPYVVLCIELAEGARMFGRLADAEAEPRIGMAVSAIIEEWDDGGCAPAFVPAGEAV
jgi:uncharacterized OB-fold protein